MPVVRRLATAVSALHVTFSLVATRVLADELTWPPEVIPDTLSDLTTAREAFELPVMLWLASGAPAFRFVSSLVATRILSDAFTRLPAVFADTSSDLTAAREAFELPAILRLASGVLALRVVSWLAGTLVLASSFTRLPAEITDTSCEPAAAAEAFSFERSIVFRLAPAVTALRVAFLLVRARVVPEAFLRLPVEVTDTLCELATLRLLSVSALKFAIRCAAAPADGALAGCCRFLCNLTPLEASSLASLAERRVERRVAAVRLARFPDVLSVPWC